MLWDLIIRARQLTRVTPLLEGVLSRVTRLKEEPPRESVPELLPILSTGAMDHANGNDALVRGH